MESTTQKHDNLKKKRGNSVLWNFSTKM